MLHTQGSLIVKAEESMRCKTHAVYNQTLVWKLDGTVISNSISYKKLRLLEVATNYITEKEVKGPFLP